MYQGSSKTDLQKTELFRCEFAFCDFLHRRDSEGLTLEVNLNWLNLELRVQDPSQQLFWGKFRTRSEPSRSSPFSVEYYRHTGGWTGCFCVVPLNFTWTSFNCWTLMFHRVTTFVLLISSITVQVHLQVMGHWLRQSLYCGLFFMKGLLSKDTDHQTLMSFAFKDRNEVISSDGN